MQGLSQRDFWECLFDMAVSVPSTATIFAALLLRSPTKQDLAEKRKAQEFFQHFLVQDLS